MSRNYKMHFLNNSWGLKTNLYEKWGNICKWAITAHTTYLGGPWECFQGISASSRPTEGFLHVTVYVDVPNRRVKSALKVAREKHRVKNTDEDLNRNKKGRNGGRIQKIVQNQMSRIWSLVEECHKRPRIAISFLTWCLQNMWWWFLHWAVEYRRNGRFERKDDEFRIENVDFRMIVSMSTLWNVFRTQKSAEIIDMWVISTCD